MVILTVLFPSRGGAEVEEVLADDEQPLALLVNSSQARGSLAFHIRRRPPASAATLERRRGGAVLVELSGGGRRISIPLHRGEVRLGSAVNGAASPLNVQLAHRQVGPLHCQFSRDRATGQAVVRPVDEAFPVLVNERRVVGPSLLEAGSSLRLGSDLLFRFELLAHDSAPVTGPRMITPPKPAHPPPPPPQQPPQQPPHPENGARARAMSPPGANYASVSA